MTFVEAITTARQGYSLRRASEMTLTNTGKVTPDGTPILEAGQEGFRVMHAWTVDEVPVQIFVGSGSKCLFVPDDEMRTATDWVIEQGGQHD